MNNTYYPGNRQQASPLSNIATDKMKNNRSFRLPSIDTTMKSPLSKLCTREATPRNTVQEGEAAESKDQDMDLTKCSEQFKYVEQDDSDSSSPILGPFSGPWKGVGRGKKDNLGVPAAFETSDAPVDIVTPIQHLNSDQSLLNFWQWLALHGDDDDIRYVAQAQAREVADSMAPLQEDFDVPVTFPGSSPVPRHTRPNSKKPVVNARVVEILKPLEAEVSDASVDVPTPTRTWVIRNLDF